MPEYSTSGTRGLATFVCVTLSLFGCSAGSAEPDQSSKGATTTVSPVTAEIRAMVAQNALQATLNAYTTGNDFTTTDSCLHVLGVGSAYVGSLALLGLDQAPIKTLGQIESTVRVPNPNAPPELKALAESQAKLCELTLPTALAEAHARIVQLLADAGKNAQAVPVLDALLKRIGNDTNNLGAQSQKELPALMWRLGRKEQALAMARATKLFRQDVVASLAEAAAQSGTAAELEQIVALAEADTVKLKAVVAAQGNRWEDVTNILDATAPTERRTIGDSMMPYLGRASVSDTATTFARKVVDGTYVSGEASFETVARYLVKAGQADLAVSLLPKLTGRNRARLQIQLAGDAKRRGETEKANEFIEAARQILKAESTPSSLPVREIAEAGLDDQLAGAIEDARTAALRQSSGSSQRFDLIELASDLASVGKADLAAAELKRAAAIADDFGRCRDLARIAYVYAKATQFGEATNAVDSCSSGANSLWKLFAHMVVLRVRATQTNEVFKKNYDPFDEMLSLEYQFKFNAPLLLR